MNVVIVFLCTAFTAVFFFWLGWDTRGDIEERKRWERANTQEGT